MAALVEDREGTERCCDRGALPRVRCHGCASWVRPGGKAQLSPYFSDFCALLVMSKSKSKSKWAAGQVIDIDTEDGLEPAKITGPAKNKKAKGEMRVEFDDGTGDDWDIDDFRSVFGKAPCKARCKVGLKVCLGSDAKMCGVITKKKGSDLTCDFSGSGGKSAVKTSRKELRTLDPKDPLRFLVAQVCCSTACANAKFVHGV